MPRAVRVAIVTSCIIALLGVVSIAIWTIDVFGDDRATRWVSATLGVRSASLRLLFNPLYVQGLAIVSLALKRDTRARELVFQMALLAALLLGFLALGGLVIAVLERRMDADFAGTIIVFGLAAVLAWSLSRPSAKAWFTPTAVP